LTQTVSELKRLGISVRDVAVDGGFNVGPTNAVLEDFSPRTVHRQPPGTQLQNAPTPADATEQAGRAVSATSNAVMGWTDPG
jgi:hypothetical protein